jgi:Cu(I)/Ag(I) efflux system membrane protein CusA/SilA
MVAWHEFNLSVAVAVGFIALGGIAVETGVLVLTFIEEAVAERRDQMRLEYRRGETRSLSLTAEEIAAAVHSGTSRRVRAVFMTAASTIVGLLQILVGAGTGSEVMQRIAVPMVGGMFTTSILSLLILPVVYGLILQLTERRHGDAGRLEELASAGGI